MQTLNWYKTLDHRWINLMEIDLHQIKALGVYIIWHGGSAPRIVRVGEGDIAIRLHEHKHNMRIRRYLNEGPLMVTWAVVPDPVARGGIERSLSEQLQPLLRGRLSRYPELAVRSPFV